MSVGGAGLAAVFRRRGLIDEYRLFVSPVILGGGTPYSRRACVPTSSCARRGQVVYLRLSSRS